MSEKQQIQTLEKVLQIILLSFELSNSVEETVPKPLIEDLKEVIEYCKSEGAELDVCVYKMKKFNKKVSFYEVFEEGGIVNDNPIASVVGGEVALSDAIIDSIKNRTTPAQRVALTYGNHVLNQKPLCEEGELNETEWTENFRQNHTMDSASYRTIIVDCPKKKEKCQKQRIRRV